MIRKLFSENVGLCRKGHAHRWPIVVSRREFVRTATGAAAAGLTLGAGVWTPGFAAARKNGEKENEENSIAPVPIPGGSPGLSPFHVFGPTPDGSFDPIDAEPITITDFNGFSVSPTSMAPCNAQTSTQARCGPYL